MALHHERKASWQDCEANFNNNRTTAPQLIAKVMRNLRMYIEVKVDRQFHADLLLKERLCYSCYSSLSTLRAIASFFTFLRKHMVIIVHVVIISKDC